MSLPAGQQRVLNRIEDGLRASEPALNSMYATFARLSAGEPVAAERLVRRRLRLRNGSAMYAIVLIPVMFIALVTGALLGGAARSSTACEASYSLGGVSPLAGRPSCPVPGKASSVVKIAARKAVSASLTCAARGTPARFTTLGGRSREFPAAPPAVYPAVGAPAAC